jgi:hypothetical protein
MPQENGWKEKTLLLKITQRLKLEKHLFNLLQKGTLSLCCAFIGLRNPF